MLTRQRVVLCVLAEAGGGLGKSDLVNLLFLAAQTADLPPRAAHEFVPFPNGPHSFSLEYDLRHLEESGFLHQEADRVEISDKGRAEAEKIPSDIASLVAATLGRYRKEGLGDYIRNAYPWYAANHGMTRPVADIAIYTTGYEGVEVDGLLNRILKKGIQRMIDVRFNPTARRYGFHKSTLAGLCPQVGIEYIHVPELGIPGSWRSDLSSPSDREALFSRYAKEVLPNEENAMDEVVGLIQNAPSALMCKEADPIDCHRTTLANELSARMGLPVFDLTDKRPSEA